MQAVTVKATTDRTGFFHHICQRFQCRDNPVVQAFNEVRMAGDNLPISAFEAADVTSVPSSTAAHKRTFAAISSQHPAQFQHWVKISIGDWYTVGKW